jgi:two-component system, NarL family, response regulator DevR
MMGAMESLPASVLVIESHPIMRTALCTAIAEEPGLRVAEPNGSDPQSLTISVLGNIYDLPHNLDIILLALGNPGQKELDVLAALHRLQPGIPVLALTSDEVPGQEQAALEAGAQAVLAKSASRGEIIHALQEMQQKKSFIQRSRISEQEVIENTSDHDRFLPSSKSGPDGSLANQ